MTNIRNRREHYLNDLQRAGILSPSVVLLQRRIAEYFEKQKNPCSFPGSGCDLIWSSVPHEPTNVVLFGDAFARLGGSAFWPRGQRYSLHFLCTSFRNAMADALEVSPSLFGVIPRYEIFPEASTPLPFPDLSRDPVDLLVTGRFARGKNILEALTFAGRLKKNNDRIRIRFFGPKFVRDWASEASKLAGTEVELLGDLGPEWYKKDFRNPLLMNLSCSYTEDFGVTVAQAQAVGMPLILSDWNAHRDVRGENVRLIHPVNIPTAGIAHLQPAREPSPENRKNPGILSFDDLSSFREKLLTRFPGTTLDFANITPVSASLAALLLKHLQGEE